MTKYIILSKTATGGDESGIADWSKEDIRRHLGYLEDLNRELVATGELVAGEALAGPDRLKLVEADGTVAPVVTDGIYLEAKEIIVGYQTIDVESEARAIQIAARVSAAPGPGGAPLRQPIELREVMGNLPGIELWS